MKKSIKILIYICLVVLIILSGIFIYKVFANQNNQKGESKGEEQNSSIAELKYFEDRFVSLFNQLNNISFDNYKISTSKIEENNSNSTSNNGNSTGGANGSNSSQGGGGSSQSSNGGSSGSSVNSNGNNTLSSNTNESTKKQFKMEGTGILTGDKNINWTQIQNDVETMYTKMYSCTLNLYQKQINKDDILNFNKEFDNLTVSVKSMDKAKTLDSLSKLYGYMPEFIDGSGSDEKERVIIKTKNGILQAYSLLDKEDWKAMLDYINNSSQEFSKMMTDVNSFSNENQYNINKVYIMINELASATNLQDKDVFLIKYKNVMEELQNL